MSLSGNLRLTFASMKLLKPFLTFIAVLVRGLTNRDTDQEYKNCKIRLLDLTQCVCEIYHAV